jgi:hypothetical protein
VSLPHPLEPMTAQGGLQYVHTRVEKGGIGWNHYDE